MAENDTNCKSMVLFCDILIAEFYDIRVKRSKSRSCLHDKTFELGTRQT